MPLVQVEVIGPVRSRHGLASRISEAVAKVFGGPPGSAWVRVRVLPRRDYAENGGSPAGISPVFVSVLKARPAPRRKLRVEIAALTRAVARACGRPPGSVHVLYEPPAAGRLAFGGRLVG